MRPAPLIAALAIPPLAAAAIARPTAYNNFGPAQNGWDYNWGLGWTVAGTNLPSQYGVEQAMGFVAAQSGTVTDLWVAMWYVPLDTLPDVVTIRLARNPAGLPPTPDDVMETWTISQFESWSQWSPPRHLVGSGASQLLQGDSYWLWASADPTTWTGWCMNVSPSFTCPHTLRRENENWLPIAAETASAFRIDVALPCYANCDSSTTAPILNVLDFLCFLNRFASGDAYANCDQSTTAPVLNVLDFTCFLNAFAAGCP